MRTKTAAALLLVCSFSGVASAQATYTVTDLGQLSPTAINSWAQVVGNYNNEAYMWSFGRMRPLGKLPGGAASSAAAINDLGVVVGTADGVGTVTSFRSSDPLTIQCPDLTQPFVWTAAGGMQGLGGVGDPNYTYGWCDYLPWDGAAINDAGQVVGYLAESYNATQWGFVWTKATGMTIFGGSWTPTFALGVNNFGLIVGQDADQSSPYTDSFFGNAESWNGNVATDLGTLGGGIPYFNSAANGVNDRGQIVGWSSTEVLNFAGTPVHAVLWDPGTGIADLGTLPGDMSSAALKINFFGRVIGLSGEGVVSQPFWPNQPFAVTGRPFVWSKRDGMQDLNQLIPAHSGWVLNSVTDINYFGQIVGSGTHNGKSRGFLLTPTHLFADL